MPKCLKCGKCCYWMDNGVLKRCPFLKKDNSCPRYYHRHGLIIGTQDGKPVYCNYRKEVPYDYNGCPYNTGKPIEVPL